MNRRMGKQGGWVGLIVILLSLAIVAWLAKDALREYGLLSGPGKAAESSGLQRSPTPAAVSDFSGGTSATSSLQAPLERARGVEDTVLRGAATQSRQVEESAR
jgi:hypothetical protein